MIFDWPHTIKQVKRPCAVCGKDVYQNQNLYNKDKWSPDSKYWNLEHKEIYCGVEHSLHAYEERRCMTS